ncbi:ankyrin repeat-containing domain protein [Gorgonomyces haynaldii]|nr:ankyrin repeat-containing domain protein [Gorgonomyces haynaldii]
MPSVERKNVENIWILCADGDYEGVKALLDKGESPDAQDDNGYCPLHAAVSYGHRDLVELLIERGCNLNLQDNDLDTALHLVESLDLAQLLVEKGADPTLKNQEGTLPIESQWQDARLEIVKFLEAYTPEYRQLDPETEVDMQWIMQQLQSGPMEEDRLDTPDDLEPPEE